MFWFVLCSVLGLKGVFVTAETEVGYGDWWKHTSGGLSDTFQTTDRQSDFRPNHRWVMCNYSFFFFFSDSLFGRVVHQCYQYHIIITIILFMGGMGANSPWHCWQTFYRNTLCPSLFPFSSIKHYIITCKFRKLVRQEVKTLEQSHEVCDKHGSIHINVLPYMEGT